MKYLTVTTLNYNGKIDTKLAFYQRAISQARILLGLSGSGLGVCGETENVLLLAERFGTLFLIGLLTNLPPGDVTRWAKTKKKKLNYQNFHKFTVLFETLGNHVFLGLKST